MSAQAIADLIPAIDRKQILDENVIAKALPIEGDVNMHYLVTVWKIYIEPGFIETCNSCRNRVLENYRQLQPLLVAMELESNLLNSI